LFYQESILKHRSEKNQTTHTSTIGV